MAGFLLSAAFEPSILLDLMVQYDFDVEIVVNYVILKKLGLSDDFTFSENEKFDVLLDLILSGTADEEKVHVRKGLLDALHMQMDYTNVFLTAAKQEQLFKQFLDPVVMEEGFWPPMRLPFKTLDGKHINHSVIYVDEHDEGTVQKSGDIWRATNLKLMMWTLLMCVYKKNRKVHGRITSIVNQVLTPLIDYGKMMRTFIFKENNYFFTVEEYKWDKGSAFMHASYPFFEPATCKDYDFYTRAIV